MRLSGNGASAEAIVALDAGDIEKERFVKGCRRSRSGARAGAVGCGGPESADDAADGMRGEACLERRCVMKLAWCCLAVALVASAPFAACAAAESAPAAAPSPAPPPAQMVPPTRTGRSSAGTIRGWNCG